MIMYVFYGADLVVQGCSSNIAPGQKDSFIRIKDNLLSEHFYRNYYYYKVDLASNAVIFDEELQKKAMGEKEKVLTKEQVLGQTVSELEIQILMLTKKLEELKAGGIKQ